MGNEPTTGPLEHPDVFEGDPGEGEIEIEDEA